MSKVQSLWKKNNPLILTQLFSLGMLLAGFALCRFVFFEFQGMKEWPVDLLIAGLIVHVISMFAKKQYVPWFTSIGYFLGFWLGVIFHKEGFDPGGGRTNNLWQIWTVVFVACILAGVVFDSIKKWQKLMKTK